MKQNIDAEKIDSEVHSFIPTALDRVVLKLRPVVDSTLIFSLSYKREEIYKKLCSWFRYNTFRDPEFRNDHIPTMLALMRYLRCPIVVFDEKTNLLLNGIDQLNLNAIPYEGPIPIFLYRGPRGYSPLVLNEKVISLTDVLESLNLIRPAEIRTTSCDFPSAFSKRILVNEIRGRNSSIIERWDAARVATFFQGKPVLEKNFPQETRIRLGISDGCSLLAYVTKLEQEAQPASDSENLSSATASFR